MARVRRLTLALTVLAALPAPAAAAAPVLHADRGAHTAYGRPELGEDTLPAFRAAFRAWGAVVEVDAALTADGVPVAMHDPTLDRTTICAGRVADRTLAGLAVCPVDTVGSPGGPLGGAAAACPQAIPTIAEVLVDARDSGATVNLDISGEPGAPGLAAKVMDVVAATGMPAARLILQSSSPADLDIAKARLPGVATSLVTPQAGNAAGPTTASSRGYEWVSPEWPVDAAYVAGAHALGRKVVPYPVDDAGRVQAAAALGVDALITDDPGMARRALGLPDGTDPGGLACPALPPLPPGLLGPPAVQILVPGLASDAFTSPHLRLRWRGRGADDARAEAFVATVRPAGSHRTADWRALVADAPRRATLYTATSGSTFVLRVAARDAAGRFGPTAVRAVTVPLDDANPRVRRSGPWRRARSRGAWGRRLSASRSRRARLTLRFTGRRLRVVARRSAHAGRLAVTIDGRRRVIATAGATAPRAAVFDSGRLRSGRHRVVLRPAGGGRVEVDAIAPS
jgi:glycerophosphoryl diester phosphodiesterase